MEKEISRSDLKKLLRLTGEIAELQMKYINQGFNAQEIAGAFAASYSRQFEKMLTPEIAAKIGPDSSHQSQVCTPACSSDATISYCLILCGEMMKVTTKRLKNSR